MMSILKNLRITQKLNLSFVMIVAAVFLLVGLSYLYLRDLQANFIFFNQTAAKTTIIGNQVEDILEARLAALKYRILPAQSHIGDVQSNIAEIQGMKEKINNVITIEDTRAKLLQLADDALKYEREFVAATDRQAKADAIITGMNTQAETIISNLNRIAETAYADQDPVAAYHAGRVMESFMAARLSAAVYFLQKRPDDSANALSELDNAIARTNVLLTELQNPQRRALATEIRTILPSYQGAFTEVSSLLSERNRLYADLDVIGPDMMDAYDALFDSNIALQDKVSEESLETIRFVITKSLVIGAVIGLLAGILAYAFGRFLSVNMAMIIGQMTRLSKGDKTFAIEGKDRRDEIGEMAVALDVFKTGMIEQERLEAEARKKQEEELKKAERTMKAVQVFETEISKISNMLNQSAGMLQSLATQLASAMEETTQQSGAVAAASQEASTNVQTVAAAAEEMAASIQEISRNITDTATTARNCADAAETSKQKLELLQQAVADIDGVIQAINDVAEQTNLLALNATIEAARAGEAGKGFAVVANEVKSLAGETHKMTEEIAQKVEDIKNSARDTIQSVTGILEQISSVDHKTTSVAGAIEEQEASTQEISRNVQEAAMGTGEVSRSIEQVQQAANDSAGATETLKGASDDLAEKAHTLKDVVDKFLKEVRAAA